MKQIIAKVSSVVIALLISFGALAKGPPIQPALLKDANGMTVGRVIGMETVSWPYVLTEQGYRTLFMLNSGMVNLAALPIGYGNFGCTPPIYTSSARYLGAVFTIDGGENDYSLFYSPNDAEQVNVTVYSFWSGNDCIDLETPEYLDAWPVYANDPDLTGIANEAYPARMLIQ